MLRDRGGRNRRIHAGRPECKWRWSWLPFLSSQRGSGSTEPAHCYATRCAPNLRAEPSVGACELRVLLLKELQEPSCQGETPENFTNGCRYDRTNRHKPTRRFVQSTQLDTRINRNCPKHPKPPAAFRTTPKSYRGRWCGAVPGFGRSPRQWRVRSPAVSPVRGNGGGT